ncbi:arylsulfatase [Euzebyella marina]|uniref:Arylsulfatase n=1 Tax=Euzebyella marina TaxID=1761453 RepID=A0A3G2L9M9_9FLAO|nr:arylsulfatase [Euzebyella marina]AYN68923.1 arylsulfatase [Euzebyella marina]
MKKPAFYLILSVFHFLVLSCSDKKENKSTKEATKLPNIIYVLADDLGYGDIHSFNTKGKIKTPNIDRLASNGMKFTDAHTSSAVCTPTRYGILTGRYNWRSPLKSGVLTGRSKALIPTERSTVASILKKSGYHTAFIGKWHLGWDWAQKDSLKISGEGWNPEDFENIDFKKPIKNGPQDLGFDYSYGHSGSLDMAPYVYVENGIVTAEVDTVTVDKGKYTWWREGPTASDFDHDDVTPNFFRKSMDFVKDRSNKSNPFFLYLALPSPHTPILPTDEWLDKSGLNPYADFVMQIDDYMGQLMKVIDEAGITENTLVIFTSDNGCSPQADFKLLASKGHQPSGAYRGHKADIYEGGHRVPFIASWPAVIKLGSVQNQTICTTDLMATCAEIANKNLSEDEAEDSFSMLPLFRSVDGYGREAIVHHSINGSFAIRKGDYKLVFCPGSGGWSDPKPNSSNIDSLPPMQLFDLVKDPSEQQNLYGEKPEKVKELTDLMVSYIKKGRSTPGTDQENSMVNLKGEEWQQLKTIIPN